MPKNVELTGDRLVVGQQEAARLLGVSAPVIRKMMRDGKLAVVIIGDKPKITMASIHKLLGR